MKISKVSHFFPQQIKKIDRFSFENDLDYQHHQRFVGTRQLHLSEIGTTGSDLALEAAKRLLRQIPKQHIDFLIFSSLTLDYKTPTTASVLHRALGLKNSCGVLDVPSGCAAFPTALALANGFFLSGSAKCILIVLGEVPSQAVDPQDPSLRNLMSDAGVAVIVEPSTNPSHFVFGNDGEGFDYLKVEQGGARFPFTMDYLKANLHQPQLNRFGTIAMDGQGILKMTLKNIPTAIHELLRLYQYDLAEIDYFLFHQGSNILLEALARKMKVPESKMLNFLAVYGNTVSCSIPLAWYHAEKEGKFHSGDKILCMGFGVGFSWSGTILHYP